MKKTSMMKKPILFLLSLALFAGCGTPVSLPGTGPEPETASAPLLENWTYEPPEAAPFDSHLKRLGDKLFIEDGYLYFDGGEGAGKVIPMRLNLETGNVTAVCPDPVCTHKTPDCPLYGTWAFLPTEIEGHTQLIVERRYSYRRKMLIGTEQLDVHRLERFDPASGKSVVLEEYDFELRGFSPEIYYGQYRFRLSWEYDEAHRRIGSMARMNLLNGSEDVLFPGETAQLLFVRDGRIWAVNETEIFSFDALAEHPAETRRTERAGRFGLAAPYRTDGVNIYGNGTAESSGEIRVIPIAGGEEGVLSLDPVPHAVGVSRTDTWYFYTAGEAVILGKTEIYGYASDVVELYGGELRKCRPDGSEDQLVFRFDGEWASCRPLDTVCDGRYLYCVFYWWEDPDGDGIYRDGDQRYSYPVNGRSDCIFLRIDTETGEAVKIVVREDGK